MNQMLSWQSLLSEGRLRRRPEARASATRSPFQQDADLIVFSAAFRRLQDKTQVQPLAEGGRVRSRLTHSIEVASVGRSLGGAAAHALSTRRGLTLSQQHAMAHIVHAACLAHDIGNPPFGHGGEDAIEAWFEARPEVTRRLSPAQAADLCSFDGNAQGFRILTALENYRFDGGLRLTHATLGALMKYPVRAVDVDPSGHVLARKKPGFFSAEQDYARELREALGLAPGQRHPLVYLTEAADDICYAIVDLEDGYEAGLLPYPEAVEVLGRLADAPADPRLAHAEQLQKLRGIAIGRLVDAVSEVFVDMEPGLLRGECPPDLCTLTPLGPTLSEAKALARRRIYAAPAVLHRLHSGQRVIGELLDQFVPAALAFVDAGYTLDALPSDVVATLMRLRGEVASISSRYDALLAVTDFVSGLTDHATLTLQRRLAGWSVPPRADRTAVEYDSRRPIRGDKPMFESLPMAPPDPILGLTEAFKSDPNPNKINLGVGVYQDEDGKTTTLASVRRAEALLLEQAAPKTYLPIEGSTEYGKHVRTLLFGAQDPRVSDGRAVTAQSPGGTGALRVAADLARGKLGLRRVWVSDPTWANHQQIFQAAGLEVETYPYYDSETHGLAFDKMLAGLARAGEGDLVLLHACCHNPSGVDPTPAQWDVIAELAQQQRFTPLFDFAYQGFGDGVEADAGAVRKFVARDLELFVCSSFSKNFGLYNERVGAITLVANDVDAGQKALSQLRATARANYSNPPSYGAAVVSKVLGNPELNAQWHGEVDAMRARIAQMRTQLVEGLKQKGVKQDFSFIVHQKGMFSFAGITPEQVDALRQKHGIYAVRSGRINVAGIRTANLDRLTGAIADVLKSA